MIVMKLFMFEHPTLKMSLICPYFFLTNFSQFLCSDKMFYCGSCSGITLLYKHVQLLRVEALKWTKIKQLSTSHAQIVPRLKQLTSQQSIFLVAEN